MPRATNQIQLLESAQTNWDKLQKEVSKLSQAELVDPGTVGDWSVKDVLAHLLEWQQMTLSWYRAGKAGESVVTPSTEFTWREIPALNQAIFAKHKTAELTAVQQALAASHQEALDTISASDDAELFTPKIFAWTKSTTVGAYFISATASHYDWARKEIRKGLKRKRQT